MSRNDGIIGVSDHGGWAVMVTAAADGTLLDRRRVELVDEDLPKADWVNFHPLHNAASTTLRSADLLRFMRALGYDPLIVDCGP